MDENISTKSKEEIYLDELVRKMEKEAGISNIPEDPNFEETKTISADADNGISSGEDNGDILIDKRCVAFTSQKVSITSHENFPETISTEEMEITDRFCDVFATYFATYSSKVRTGNNLLRWNIDPKSEVHVVIWSFRKKHHKSRLIESIFEQVMGNLPYRYETKRKVFIGCIMESSRNTRETLDAFTKLFDGLSLVFELPMTEEVKEMLYDIEEHRIGIHLIENYLTKHGMTLLNRMARIVWDDSPKKCISKAIRLLVYRYKRLPTVFELWEAMDAWGIKQLLGDGDWSEQAKAYLRKYEANWDASKVSTNPVFFGGFTATLKQEMPSDELLKWSRQELTWDEIEAVLFKITRRIVAGGRQPCRIPRRYLQKAWTEIGPKIGRRLNNSKIGYITNLLMRYGMLTKRRGHKKPSLYGLGENNPFKEGLEF